MLAFSPCGSWFRRRRLLGALLGAIVAAAVAAAAQRSQDEPVFRARVDQLAVDVQVVDRNGTPIAGLTADKFDVLVDGKRRKVVSADLITFGRTPAAPQSASPAGPAAAPPSSSAPAPESRLFVLAIDGMSFKPAEGHAIVRTIQGFLAQLAPDDRVGVIEFPTGPTVNPTTDRAAINKALDVLMGLQTPVGRAAHLRPSEASDIAELYAGCPNQVEFLKPIFAAACGAQDNCGCIVPLAGDAMGLVLENEDAVARSVAGLGDVMEALAAVHGRKTVVLLSAGVPTADRGLHASDQSVAVGQAAARANVSIYTLFVDRGMNDMTLAETAEPPYTLTNLGLDSMMAERWLDLFTGTAGGAFIRVIGKNPELAFQRVLTETSSYYLLGVAADRTDRDGRAHALSVKLRQTGATVRSRNWVVVPPPDNAAVMSPAPKPAAPAGRASRDAIERAYERGEYAAFRQELAALKDPSKWMADLAAAPALWPDAPRREAMFVLETGTALLNGPTDGVRAGAAQLLSRYSSRLPRSEDAGEFECTWYWAALTAFERSPSAPAGVPLSGRAAVRCPAVGQVLLARAIVMDRASPVRIEAGPDGIPIVAMPPASQANDILLAYRSAMRAPEQANEARARLGSLLLRLRRFDDVLALLGNEPAGTRDRSAQDVYVVDFVRAQALRAKGDFQRAEESYRIAMTDCPGAQSAPVALMTMLTTRGRSADAESVAETIKDLPPAPDPWQAFQYGNSALLPEIVDSLRKAIR